jgi:hypothetical protein
MAILRRSSQRSHDKTAAELGACTALIVAAEASTTGRPLLAWNVDLDGDASRTQPESHVGEDFRLSWPRWLRAGANRDGVCFTCVAGTRRGLPVELGGMHDCRSLAALVGVAAEAAALRPKHDFLLAAVDRDRTLTVVAHNGELVSSTVRRWSLLGRGVRDRWCGGDSGSWIAERARRELGRENVSPADVERAMAAAALGSTTRIRLSFDPLGGKVEYGSNPGSANERRTILALRRDAA